MKHIINWHEKKYPLMTEQDIYFLIYQNYLTFSKAIYPLPNEATSNSYHDLYEYISDDLIRIYLRPYINYHLNLDYLNKAHLSTSSMQLQNQSKLISTLESLNIPTTYLPNHSQIYLNHYDTDYQIINTSFLTDEIRYLQIYHFLTNLTEPSIISLEGKCAAGKTTITNKLKDSLNITVIPVDDFFLPPQRKTKERLAEVGGNIDYERIYKLLEDLKNNQQLTYFRYNCANGTYEKVDLTRKDIIILEGVYSYHPYFRKFIDKLIYIDINEKTQLNRLKQRFNFQRFIKEWIPLENCYFDNEKIKYQSDLIV